MTAIARHTLSILGLCALFTVGLSAQATTITGVVTTKADG